MSSLSPIYEADGPTQALDTVIYNMDKLSSGLYGGSDAVSEYIEAIEKAAKVEDKTARELLMQLAKSRKVLAERIESNRVDARAILQQLSLVKKKSNGS